MALGSHGQNNEKITQTLGSMGFVCYLPNWDFGGADYVCHLTVTRLPSTLRDRLCQKFELRAIRSWQGLPKLAHTPIGGR